MATAEQLKALLKSHSEGDEERFYAISMQIAAHAARKGQGKLAQELRALIDEAKERQAISRREHPVPIARPTGELADLVAASYPKIRLSDMVLDAQTRCRLERVLREYRERSKLYEHGLAPKRKLLLIGPPGTGKTMTAAALAGELHLPLLLVRLEVLITRFLGETAAKLRLIFDAMETRGIYFFDEFDAIGGDRSRPHDVGEIRRVLNSFLQFLEQDQSDSLIVAATNYVGLLDQALFRRFDDVIQFALPSPNGAEQLVRNRLSIFGISSFDWDRVRLAAEGLSYAEIARACDEAAKDSVLADSSEIEMSHLLTVLNGRSRAQTSSQKRNGPDNER